VSTLRTSIVPPPWQLTGSGVIMLYRFPREWALRHGWVPDELRAAFVGGVGAVMLVDYTASGVGPYREALFIPGQFRLDGRLCSSITRIFVSSQPSVDSGRANWGIPKELADFQVAGDLFRAGYGGEAFLEAELQAIGPHLPADSAWSPAPLRIAQLLAGRLLVTAPAGRGSVRLARLRHLRADPAVFPDVSRFRPLLAVRATGFALTFPVPDRVVER
jgi:hypothetical protein